jgi:hypothetical protein
MQIWDLLRGKQAEGSFDQKVLAAHSAKFNGFRQ